MESWIRIVCDKIRFEKETTVLKITNVDIDSVYQTLIAYFMTNLQYMRRVQTCEKQDLFNWTRI